MVTDRRSTRRTLGPGASRAQLILIGAIAIAVVVVGLTVLANSTLVTGASGSTDVAGQSADANEFDFEARRGVRSLVLRMNHRHRALTPAEFATVVGHNVTLYERVLSESYVRSSGASVTVSYHNDSSAFGRRLVQAADGNLTRDQPPAQDGNLPDWEPVHPGDRRTVGWFTLNVDVPKTNESQTTITVTNASGASVVYDLNRTSTGSGVALRVHSAVSYGGETTAVCEASRDRVLLDLRAGRAVGSDCTFNGTDAVTGPVSVDVTDGLYLHGKYEIVVNESINRPYYGDCVSGGGVVAADQPCLAPAVWTANVSTRFTGSQVAYDDRFNVSVYEVDR